MRHLAWIGAVGVVLSGCSIDHAANPVVPAFTESRALHGVGLAFPNAGQIIATYSAPWLSANGAMTIGPDHNIWVLGLQTIAKVTTSGKFTTYGAADIGNQISAGPGGSVWYSTSNGVGWISTSGSKHKVVLPNGDSTQELVQSPNGNVWFTDFGHAAIGQIDLSGEVTEYSTPSQTYAYPLVATTAGLWSVDNYGSDWLFSTTTGQMTESTVYQNEYGCFARSVVKYGQGGVLSFVACLSYCGYVAVVVLHDGGPRLPCAPSGFCTLPANAATSYAPDNPSTALYYSANHDLGIFSIGPGTFTKIPLPNGGWATSVLLGPDGNIGLPTR